MYLTHTNIFGHQVTDLMRLDQNNVITCLEHGIRILDAYCRDKPRRRFDL